MGLNLTKLAEITAKLKAAQAVQSPTPISSPPPSVSPVKFSIPSLDALSKAVSPEEESPVNIGRAIAVHAANVLIALDNAEKQFTATDRFGKTITYNDKQLEFVKLAASGADCILIGPAGTGKTTSMKGVVSELIQSGTAGVISENCDHKHLRPGTPGIVVVAYTRRAVNNIRKNMPEDMKDNCITIHKLLEYEPVFYEVVDEATGKIKKKMEFRPARNELNPLPPSIHTIIFEESSMIGTELYGQVENALCHPHQELFLGDIQQLPPVFGPAILGFKLQSLTTVELTEVYRQALESPIIRLAHRILRGEKTTAADLKTIHDECKSAGLSIKPWAKTIPPEHALGVMGRLDPNNLGLFPKLIASGGYDPAEDMILIPQNVSFGTDELNKYIAQYLAHTAGREVYEVIAGFDKVYFSIGEKIMYERNDGIITDIQPNPLYGGSKIVRKPSKTLTYWGMETGKPSKEDSNDVDDATVDFMIGQMQLQDEDRVHAASHIVTVKLIDSDKEIKLDKAAQINGTILGYALTVHKAQGSEWRRVFLVFHQSHNRMLQRELLYTAVTRAREELVIICEKDSFEKGIDSQRIKGNTLAEKAEYFKGKYSKTDADFVGTIRSRHLD